MLLFCFFSLKLSLRFFVSSPFFSLSLGSSFLFPFFFFSFFFFLLFLLFFWNQISFFCLSYLFLFQKKKKEEKIGVPGSDTKRVVELSPTFQPKKKRPFRFFATNKKKTFVFLFLSKRVMKKRIFFSPFSLPLSEK